MPEGDTVWRTAQRLHAALAGRRLVRWDLRVPRLATTDLTGRPVLEVVPRGKHLLVRVEGGLTLHSHLRMDGAWRIYRAGERWSGGPGHQIRAVLANTEHTAVGYRLPVLDLLRTADEGQVVGHLGPDLLGPDWDPREALRRLSADPTRPLGAALLDQRNLAGIGNVYKSELCFLLRSSPWLPIGELPHPERLVTLARKLLEANKDRLARVTTADTRTDRRLWVYGREGRPCRRCGTPVCATDRDLPDAAEGARAAERADTPAPQGAADHPVSRQRITYWCPRCQPGPRPPGI
ncbi:DNA-formamidopyrimidine glycosylase family protein [Streptomyces palmae]|uniref:DNA-(apurinic or apyrimidinic site) lyase n=1 Tax=Streptomyces palmae TaxID=1701085 RepID=A0A4Z0H8N3_9ACTN|nr:DNA-formamidopyrimidine glycosylase family protein [Streptomyces palmae]TGB13041.1 Fpg/Nei family DNA glycosylase [Streptomyces palmae]